MNIECPMPNAHHEARTAKGRANLCESKGAEQECGAQYPMPCPAPKEIVVQKHRGI